MISVKLNMKYGPGSYGVITKTFKTQKEYDEYLNEKNKNHTHGKIIGIHGENRTV